ncbi:MAG: hypothetical protein H2063_09225, partial [Synechococcus sp.]|nr:hypothetical protein [Synechococcus sp.]
MLLALLLKVAGYRRSTPQRRSSRSRRWSRSAQTLFASWAVIGQLGTIGVLVGEALEPQLAKAEIENIPGAMGTEPGGISPTPASASGVGAFAIGRGASSNFAFSMAIGSNATASGYQASAIGAGARAIRDNQMMLGASATDVTAASLAGTNTDTELILANQDGTLKRAIGIKASDGSLTVANASVTNDLSVAGDTSLTTLTASDATDLQSTLNVEGKSTLNNTSIDGNLT